MKLVYGGMIKLNEFTHTLGNNTYIASLVVEDEDFPITRLDISLTRDELFHLYEKIREILNDSMEVRN
jgi:hypothetical protein